MQQQPTRAASHELQAGEEFAGHRIEGILGRGGMGVVYRAVDMRLNRRAALKVITPALSADEDFRRRFQRESELAASVQQQNVVTMYQAGEADGLLYITMALIEGTDLRGPDHRARGSTSRPPRRSSPRSPPRSTQRMRAASCIAT